MNKEEKIDQEVEKTLQCFDKIERIESNPFFYTRVKAGIESMDQKTSISGKWQPAVAVLKPALLVLILALNIFTVVSILNKKHTEISDRDQLIKSFAQEYGLDQSEYNYIIN